MAIHPIARGFTHAGVNLSRGSTGGLPGADSTMGLRAEQARVVAGELGLLRQGRSGLPVASWVWGMKQRIGDFDERMRKLRQPRESLPAIPERHRRR